MRATYARVSGQGGTQRQAAPAPDPALYAARARGTEWNCLSRSDIRCACASMAATGSKGSRSPYERAVPGMNWAMPRAPAGETARGLNPDSAISWAARRPGETFQREAERMSGAL